MGGESPQDSLPSASHDHIGHEGVAWVVQSDRATDRLAVGYVFLGKLMLKNVHAKGSGGERSACDNRGGLPALVLSFERE